VYLKSTYQEAEARKDFIDPLLKALGWDVDHECQHNPYEQEVKVESSLNVHDARSQKRADYAFYLGPNFRDVRFYVEAKKPSVDLDRSVDSHFQTLRYGYSASTPLAVLTDFEQIRVLDCRRRPHPETALQQTYKHWHYQEFKDAEKFAEFYWLFSREAHANGSYQRRIDELPKPKGGAKQRSLFRGGYQAVDESFLQELADYRETLAKAFKKADVSLDSESLTELVQRTLDRLVFLRFLEDKQIETEIRVTDFGKSRNAWADFQASSKRLDAIYNGIVFKPLPLLDDPDFDVDANDFGDICERLAAENSPYNFDAIPIHILGSIYERFLGSVIRATEKTAKVEEKPEVRKAGGVYYTPEYIVRYIVSQTVGKLIAGKTPKEISKMCFADIACGSGSFLLGMFDELLRYHSDWYNQPGREKQAKKDGCVQTEDDRWRLSLSKRRNILKTNIYGVDLDRQAVEVAQLSLFLKLLEEERATSAYQYRLEFARNANMKKLLPDLSDNIVSGNSLIGWDIARAANLSPKDELRLNPLDFRDAFPHVMRAGGFDAIVGNPPYVLLQDELRDPLSYDYLKSHYAVASFKIDTYHLFFERAGLTLREQGRLGYITPSNFLTNNHLDELRRFLLSKLRIERIVVFEGRVFAGAHVDTAVTVCANDDTAESFEMLRVSAKPPVSFDVPAATLRRSQCLARPLFLITPPSTSELSILFDGMDARSKPLGESFDVSFGKQLRDRAKFAQDVIEVDSLAHVPATHQPCYTGKDVGRYTLSWSGLACLRSREAKRGGCWDDDIHNANPKLITRQIGIIPVFGLDDTGFHCLNTVFMLTPKAQLANVFYLLGLLNSSLFAAYWRARYYDQRERFPKIKGAYLKQLPIHAIDFSNRQEKARHDQLVALVERMLGAKKLEAGASRHPAEIATRKCAALDRQINELVYELYELTEEEMRLVEGCRANPPSNLPA
jgi:type I restriction-modification system DNA methylase subunit